MFNSFFNTLRIVLTSFLFAGLTSPGWTDEIQSEQDDLKLRISECLLAFSELQDIVPNFRWKNIDDDFIRQHSGLFETYDAKCQQGLDDLKQASTRDYLSKRLGAIFASENHTVPFCTAFRLTERRLVTAEHCLWKAEKLLDESRLRFSLLALPKERLEFTVLTEHPASFGKISDKTDVAVLELGDGAILPSLASENRFDLEVATDICGEAFLLIPGVFKPSLVTKGNLGLGDWVDGVRMDGTQTCVRRSGNFNAQCILKDQCDPITVTKFYAKNNFKNKLCIVSNCQTYPGMSGAPIIGFSQQESTLFADGVFVRSGKAAPNRHNTCLDLPGMNVGVSFPEFVINILEEK